MLSYSPDNGTWLCILLACSPNVLELSLVIHYTLATPKHTSDSINIAREINVCVRSSWATPILLILWQSNTVSAPLVRKKPQLTDLGKALFDLTKQMWLLALLSFLLNAVQSQTCARNWPWLPVKLHCWSSPTHKSLNILFSLI